MTPALHQQHCTHQSGSALSATGATAMLTQVKGWTIAPGVAGTEPQVDTLHQTFNFADFHRTMAFVNALAWIANEQDHHPDLQVSYNRCTVRWSTHSVNGLSINDFICAARTDQLFT